VGRTDDGVSRMVVQRRIHSEDRKKTRVWGCYKITPYLWLKCQNWSWCCIFVKKFVKLSLLLIMRQLSFYFMNICVRHFNQLLKYILIHSYIISYIDK